MLKTNETLEAAEVTDSLIEKETIDFRELYQMVGKYAPDLAEAQRSAHSPRRPRAPCFDRVQGRSLGQFLVPAERNTSARSSSSIFRFFSCGRVQLDHFPPRIDGLRR